MSGPGGAVDVARDERGFSLVEALIALAIIAAMTAMLAETTAQDARARHAVRDRRDALLVARSALDRAVTGDHTDTGQWQALTWHIERQPYGGADPFNHAPLEQVTVTVAGADQRRLLSLTTVQIQP